MTDKSLRCRIGLHSWFHDSALFSSVRRCNYCDAVDDERAARRLDQERVAVGALSPGASLAEVLSVASAAVLRRDVSS